MATKRGKPRAPRTVKETQRRLAAVITELEALAAAGELIKANDDADLFSAELFAAVEKVRDVAHWCSE